jgi:hypothetical protein
MMLGEDWKEPYIDIMRWSKGFVLVDDKLYKRSALLEVLMKCVTGEDGYDILHEIHDGSCGNHAASKTLVEKAYRAGFYWLIAMLDAEELVCRCPNCQFFLKQSHVPSHNLITIPPSWPFACWSLNMIGPLRTAPRGFTHVLVVIDKFTKYIEYKTITKLTPDRAADFICDILHRFGFPNTIITDLGTNFTAHHSGNSATTRQSMSSMCHSHTQGQMAKSRGLMA